MDFVKLEQWRKAASDLSRIKTEEMKLRKELFADNFDRPSEGVNSIELPEGWTLKATVPYTRNLNQVRAVDVVKLLKKMKAPAGLIKTSYTLSVSDYKKLTDENVKRLVDDILTTAPGTPAMELVPPKPESV